ncbi:MAG: DNA polymerase III subunit delta [Proteobacteria bacterium]|nr:DNA polymerase III subunit delta [Pseudomonadota bacterium]
MRLYVNQLAANLSRQLKACYLIVGDEPLQLQESIDQIRKKARTDGFTEREIYHVDKSFKWHQLTNSAGTMSLFAEKKLIELFLPTGKPGRSGSAAIIDFVENIPQDVMLIIRCDEWTAANDKSKWVKSIDSVGVVLRVFLPKTAEIGGWIRNRCQSIGLKTDADAISLLSMRLEGNLLAAAQELEKLKMRFADRMITARDIAGLVADNARFDVFRLTDSLMENKPKRAIRILRSLKKNDLSPVIIHWALERETTTLCDLAFKKANRQNISTADYRKHGIWQNRQGLIQSVLNRSSLPKLEKLLVKLSDIDKNIKGRKSGDPWIAMENWMVDFVN